MSVVRVIKKFNKILSAHQMVRIVEISILMIIGGFLETMSVSLIVPFISVVMDANNMMNNSYISLVCKILHIESTQVFLISISIALALLYIAKNMYLVFEFNIQYKFVYKNMFTMQKKLLSNIIRRPYEFFLNAESGEVMRLIGGDSQTSFNLLTTLLNMFTELVVSFMLIVTIFVISPDITLIIAILLLGMMLVINGVVKPLLRKASMENQKASAGMYKWMLQSIEGIKELKVMEAEEYFVDNYSSYGKAFVHASQRNQTLSIFPRFFIEAFSMGAVFIAVAIMIARGSAPESMIPLLSTVAMAALRLLPSVNRISGALTTIAYSEPMLDNLIRTLDNLDEAKRKECGENIPDVFPVMQKEIFLSDVSYHYPDSDIRILENASMKIGYGESIGVVGASGAGKTTIVDIAKNTHGWLKQIGYIPQVIFMLDDTIRMNVAFGERLEQISEDKVWDALDQASLKDFVKSLPEGLDTRIGERGIRLSGGQRQRIGIARALYHNPNVLVFDEATSALDNETETSIMEAINQLHGKKTLIIIAHRLTTIETCDHIYRVNDGVIIMER